MKEKAYRQDKDLWLAIKRGDEGAFQVLFERHYRFLCYSAYKVYADEHKAKDFAQEVFMSLWRKRDTVEIHTSIKAFLRKAVANKAIDYIRAQRMDFEEEVSSQEIVSPSSTQAMEYDELKDFIHHTAEGLPDRCRTVFFMSRFEEMSHKEIAAALGISEKTVENQITKALKVLRQAIRQYMSMDKMQVLLFFLLFA